MSWYVNPVNSPFSELADRATELAKEFMANPIGHHSVDLQRILNRFRGDPLDGRYVLVQTKRWKEWCLGRLVGRGKPVEIFYDKKFSSIEDGEREIFRMLWKKNTGKDLRIDH